MTNLQDDSITMQEPLRGMLLPSSASYTLPASYHTLAYFGDFYLLAEATHRTLLNPYLCHAFSRRLHRDFKYRHRILDEETETKKKRPTGRGTGQHGALGSARDPVPVPTAYSSHMQ